MNSALLRPWNLFVIAMVSLAACFLAAEAKMALDRGNASNS